MIISSSTKTCLTVLVGDLRPTRSRSNTFLFVNKTEVKNCTAILLINKNKVWFLQHLPSLTSLSSLEYLQTELLCCRLAVVNKATWLCCKLALGQIQLSSISLYSETVIITTLHLVCLHGIQCTITAHPALSKPFYLVISISNKVVIKVTL